MVMYSLETWDLWEDCMVQEGKVGESTLFKGSSALETKLGGPLWNSRESTLHSLGRATCWAWVVGIGCFFGSASPGCSILWSHIKWFLWTSGEAGRKQIQQKETRLIPLVRVSSKVGDSRILPFYASKRLALVIGTSIINVVSLVYCLTFELLTQISSLGCVVSLSISILNVEISDPSTWQEKIQSNRLLEWILIYKIWYNTDTLF